MRKELLQRLSVALGAKALHNARREAMSAYLKDIEAEERRKREELEKEAERKRNALADSFDSIIAEVVELNISYEQPQEEESEDDFLTRMKEIITANEDVEHSDLDRLIILKGKGNTLAAELVEAFETSPEKPEGVK
ncbi:hypothetical protein [Enterobacter hormaechei]|uniref:hypothetical protein n=1 Tax=Enterobacter hormaechei TaxID=158836 RepID=UPI002B24E6B0|nr:hypothetical protein [Enterobacter hormaechei]